MVTDIIFGGNNNLRISGKDDPEHVERWFNCMINC